MPTSRNTGPSESKAIAAYKLGLRLAGKLRLELEPLKYLPISIWQESHSGQALYAYPSAVTGRWLCSQGSTETSMYLAHWLITFRSDLLTEAETCMLQNVQFSQAVLRAMKMSLPDRQRLQEACMHVKHTRLPFIDGWIDSGTLVFHPLPYPHTLYVFNPVLNYCYGDLMRLKEETLATALRTLSEYLPVEAEREYFMRFIGRALCSCDGHKTILGITDSLDKAMGNAAKSTLLSWVQSALKTKSCKLSSAQMLTVGKSHMLTQLSHHAIDAPVLQMFDELSTGASLAQQLDYGQLKFMSSGRRNQPATVVAANVGDFPDLRRLEQKDPAFIRRLVLLPARARFHDAACFEGACGPGIHQKLDELSPALARLMLEGFVQYKQAGSTLLPVPKSMEAFKSAVILCTSSRSGKHA